jgi:hypothetical protein
VPGDEGLAEPDGVDEIADRGRALGESSNDPEAVHVRQSLVESPQFAEVVGLVDDRRYR